MGPTLLPSVEPQSPEATTCLTKIEQNIFEGKMLESVTLHNEYPHIAFVVHYLVECRTERVERGSTPRLQTRCPYTK